MRLIEAAITGLIIIALFYGQAVTSGPTPAEEILLALAEYHEVEKADDVDRMLDAYSDDFSNSQGATKPMLRYIFESLSSQGILKTVTVDMKHCEIELNGNSASVGPINYVSKAGPGTYSYIVRKEPDGIWRIINSEQL